MLVLEVNLVLASVANSGNAASLVMQKLRLLLSAWFLQMLMLLL